MDDVAARAGVSRALVSLVMRGSPKVSDHRRLAVIDAARELGYRPNAVARSLAERRSKTFGVVINDLHNLFFADVVDGVHGEATDNGFRLLLNAAWRTEADEERAIEAFLEHRVDAVILLGSRVSHRVLAGVAAAVPLVVIGTELDGIDVVVNDDERGGELVVEHLVGLGHTGIVHVDGGPGAGAAKRRRGFVMAMEARGLAPSVIEGDFTDESGARAAEVLLARQEPPTAVFCANDLAAVAAIDRFEDAGLSVPGDISVVGYDNTSIAGLNHIGLTTVNQPRHQMGRVAVRCALERLDRGRREAVAHVLEPELIVRSTSGPPARKGSPIP
jgi:DNA-binding LacI/PurR family transcriptional regulator